MEEELRQLVRACIEDGEQNPLMPGRHLDFCAVHGISEQYFHWYFSKVVALDFANGLISFSDGDAAINRLWSVRNLGLTGFALEIYEAFDAGEFTHSGDSPETISWQKCTLPYVMESLIKAGLLPHV